MTPASRRRALLLTGAAAAVALAPRGAMAANGPDTWIGNTSANFNASNWSGTNNPPIAGDSLFFGTAGTSGLTLNDDLTAGTSFAGITFNSGASAFTIGGNSFTLGGSINNNSTSTQIINNNITLSASQTISANTGTITLGGILDSGASAFGLTKTGTGALNLTGSNTFTGDTTVAAGTINLGNSTAAGSLSSTNLGVGGSGTFIYSRTGTVTQSFTNTNVNGGFGAINNTNATGTLTLGTLTRVNSGMVDFVTTTGTITTSTSNDATGIIGAWATRGTGSSLGYAVSNGAGSITTFTGTAATAANISNVTSATTNYDYNGANITQTVPVTGNTLRITGGTITTWANGGSGIALNGLMLGGTTNVAESGAGNITIGAGTNTELDIIINAQTLTLGSNIVNNGAGASKLVIGSSNGGGVTLSGTNTYSNGTTINSGVVTLGNSSTGSGNSVTNGPLGTAAVTLNGGTIQMNTKTLGNNLVVPAGASATIDNVTNNSAIGGNVTGGGTLTVQNSSGNALSENSTGDWSGFTGTLFYNASAGSSKNFNFFIPAGFDLSNGTLITSNTTSNAGSKFCPQVSGTIKIGALSGSTGIVNNNGGSNAVTYNIGYLNANTTWGGAFGGTNVAVVKVGSGALTLTGLSTNTGNTTVENGSLIAGGNAPSGASGVFGTSANAIALGDATTISSASAMNPQLLTGGAFTVARSITVGANTTSSTNAGTTFTIGGATDNNSSFSGAIALNQSLVISQVANAGANALTVSGPITSNNGATPTVTFAGPGRVTVTGTSTYTGATKVNGGLVKLASGGILGNTAVTLGGGTLAVSGAGTIGGSIALNHNGVLDLSATTTTALTLAGNLALGDGTGAGTLTFDPSTTIAGQTSNISIGAGGSLTGTGGAVVNVGTSPLPIGTYTLVSFPNGQASGLTVGSNLSFGTVPSNFGASYALNLTSTALTLNVTGTPNPQLAYWTGLRGSLAWGATSGTSTNWSSTADGLTDTQQLPGSVTDVVFAASNAAAGSLSTSLDGPYTINSLTIAGTSPTSGTAPVIAGTGALTIGAIGSGTQGIGYAAGTGIVVSSGAVGAVISTSGGVVLANSQSWTNNAASGSLSVSSATKGTAASGVSTLTLSNTSTGSTSLSGTITDGTGGGALALNINNSGTGITAITASNGYTGGTTITAGTLQVGNANALGSGTVTVNGNLDLNGTQLSAGALAGSTSGLITNSNAAAASITSSAASSNTTYAGALQDGAGTVSLTKAGIASTLTLTGTSTNTGATTISAGTLSIGNGGTTGSIASPIANSGNLVFNRSDSLTYANTISGTGAVYQAGSGTTALSGTGSYTGQTFVNAGTLTVTGSLVGASSNAGTLSVGQSGNAANATVNIQSGATITQNALTNDFIGNGTTLTTGNGAVYQSGGTVSGISQLQIGAGASGASYGYYNLSGGTVGLKELDLGGFNGAAVGVLDISGGTMTIANWLVPSRGGNGSTGILNMTGGMLTYNGGNAFQANWGQNSTGNQTFVLNIANASLLSANGVNLDTMRNGQTTNLGEVNLLSGGLLQINGIAPGSSTGTSLVNFNGGTLKAFSANTNFLTTNLTAVNVFSGGGTIDNNGVGITIPVALRSPAGSNGVTATSAAITAGSGYVGAPAVTFTGGGGTGAAGYVTVSGGAITGLVITNPGTGYTSAPNVGLTGGGGTSGAITLAAPVANTSGGINFQGTGATTLSGAGTYGGATSILSGTVRTGIANALPTGTTLTIGSASGSGTLDLSSGANAFNQQLAGLATGGTAAIQTITNNATTAANTAILTINNDANTSNADFTFGGLIKDGSSGAKVALVKSGSRSLTLTNSNTYSGTTSVTAGALILTGKHTGGAAYTVGDGTNPATLAGTGTISNTGGISIATAATLQPGVPAEVSTGTLTTAALSFGSRATLALNLNTGAATPTADEVIADGPVSLGAGLALISVVSDLSPATLTQGSVIPILATDFATNSSDVISGQFATTSLTVGANNFNVTYVPIDGNNPGLGSSEVDLTVTAAPEPSTLGLLSVGALGLLGRRRRRMAR